MKSTCELFSQIAISLLDSFECCRLPFTLLFSFGKSQSMAYHYRALQDQMRLNQLMSPPHPNPIHSDTPPSAAGEIVPSSGRYRSSQLLPPASTSQFRREPICSPSGPSLGTPTTAPLAPPDFEDRVDRSGAPVARVSPPRPLTSPSPRDRIRPTEVSQSGESTHITTDLSVSMPKRLEEVTPKVFSGPRAPVSIGHKSAMDWVLFEENERRLANRNRGRTNSPKAVVSSPFRCQSPRFGTRSPIRNASPSQYDPGYFVRPLASSAHDFYVPPSTFERCASNTSRSSRVGTSPGRRDTPSPRRSIFEAAPQRFQRVLCHGQGMVAVQLGAKEPRLQEEPDSSVVINRTPSRVVGSSGRSGNTPGRTTPRRPGSPVPRSTHRQTGENEGTAHGAGEDRGSLEPPKSPYRLRPAPKKISVMAGAPPRFGSAVYHGSGMISPVVVPVTVKPKKLTLY